MNEEEQTENIIEDIKDIVNGDKLPTFFDKIPFLVKYGFFLLVLLIGSFVLLGIAPDRAVESTRTYSLESTLASLMFLVFLVMLGSFLEKSYHAYQNIRRK